TPVKTHQRPAETSERVRRSPAAPPPSLVSRFLRPHTKQVNRDFDSFLKIPAAAISVCRISSAFGPVKTFSPRFTARIRRSALNFSQWRRLNGHMRRARVMGDTSRQAERSLFTAGRALI
ncbi:hypothetical protein, partial [Rhizobium sp. GN54]|uniref:hypothetical protein n=1 Tax=Rhizobium sp. GN54 TaxID=2898150 RepID=UPI001E53BCA0